MMAGGGFLFSLLLHYVAFNSMMLLVHSLSSSVAVESPGHSRWVLRDAAIGTNLTFPTLKVLLSTDEGCSSSSRSTNSTNMPIFGFGFLGTDVLNPNNTNLLGVFMSRDLDDLDFAKVVWFASGDHLVGENATLDLTSKEGLSLKDAKGSLVWSTSVSGHQVKSLNLTCDGNLVLLNDSGRVVWQSFDDPRDTWLPGQTLKAGQRLTSTVSEHNYLRGFYYLSIEDQSIAAFANTSPPARYANQTSFNSCGTDNNCFKVEGGSFTFTGAKGYSFSFIRLENDGHLTLYSYNKLEQLGDLFDIDVCAYPTTCGNYGVCSGYERCDCPEDSNDTFKYFRPLGHSDTKSGCIPFTNLSCPDAHKTHRLIQLENVTYFDFESSLIGVRDVESCKKACLENCSCKAALFRYRENNSSGSCSLPSNLLTLMRTPEIWDYNATAFIKIQKQAERKGSSSIMVKLLSSILGSLVFIIMCLGTSYYYMIVRKRKNDRRETSCSSDLVIDTTSRFSFEALRLATQDFQNRLGHGGFGSVFEGILGDGTKVAVKRLDSIGQGRKEFLAEVNTIGNLHHFNLVRLIGFCDEGINRLLVYEYMQNGSLDRWIFNQDLAQALTWSLRSKIVVDVAKGLEYLHENCSQNVIHFDVKPQNILLDRDFNVKISDFGLAKMVERNQTQVMTMIRGTPGYMAPELISGGAISVKIDVYSFGVLVMEIVCGRRNFGSSEDDCLTNLVKVKTNKNQLFDLIDEYSKDMEHHKEEAVKMLRIAMWCLQPQTTRPTMSMVVKVLQDFPCMEDLSDLGYLTILHDTTKFSSATISCGPADSLLSGPR